MVTAAAARPTVHPATKQGFCVNYTRFPPLPTTILKYGVGWQGIAYMQVCQSALNKLFEPALRLCGDFFVEWRWMPRVGKLCGYIIHRA